MATKKKTSAARPAPHQASAEPERKRNYRIPFKKDSETGKVYFPTLEVLFRFVHYVLKDIVQAERDEDIFDSEVARFIYPGYPYIHQFKMGKKNVSNVIELALLARNLGVPLEWIQKIRKGEWDLEAAIAAYEARKGGAALSAQATYTGSAGSFTAVVRIDDHDAGLLGDVYATVLHYLRKAVSDPQIDESGTFV